LNYQKSSGTVCAKETAASLLKFNKTPPPTLLRAQYAIVLDHLPSVPSVVLPILSLVETDQALLLLNPFIWHFSEIIDIYPICRYFFRLGKITFSI